MYKNVKPITLKIALVMVSYILLAPVKATTHYYYPPTQPGNDAWAKRSAESLGWDTARLNDTINFVGSKNSTAFIILHKGKIVTENYWQGWDINTSDLIYSATKTVVGFMAGQAQERGYLNINSSVSTYLGPGWSNAPRFRENKITLQHLLQMSSGLGRKLFYLRPPNTKWAYNNIAYSKVYESISIATGLSNQEYSERFLFKPIGMHNTKWNFSNKRLMSSARDMARFGLMLASNGAWQKRDVIADKSYLSGMLSSSQTLNPAYGYLTWLNGKSHYTLPNGVTRDGWFMSDAPQDLVAALGKDDKKIYIVPSLDLVVVRHGGAAGRGTAAQSDFDNAIWSRLCPAIPGCKSRFNPAKLLSDNFENFNAQGWYNAGMKVTTQQAHSGSTALECGGNSHGLLSPAFNLSRYDWVRIESWYLDNGVDADDKVAIDIRNGSAYRDRFDNLGSSATEGVWKKYSRVLDKKDHPNFFQDGFKVGIYCRGVDRNESFIVDDFEIYAQ